MTRSENTRRAPRVAARAVIEHRDHILFLTAHDHATGRRWYFLPGGGVQHGESLVEALRREVLEETGVHVQVHEALFVREFIADRHHNLSEHTPATMHVLALVFYATPCAQHYASDLPFDAFGEFPGDHDGSGGVDGMCWLPLASLGDYELVPPHLNRALRPGFREIAAHGVQVWLEDTP